ncbi:gluconate transporter [Pedobacter sp. N36a]|uniref:gluconate:H+ symporter n=1 Tax=Pedobacter sp. N36a TaxID=2767996 RepID=UPI001656C1C0|nr:gluconate:H+ symporter [Pedobacter sp. N36a]MBC8987427.1 gluconate transporter [Pedobacter sp. N36a]
MTLFIVVGAILLLVLLTTWGKINAFIAFLLVSILAGILLGIPLSGITKSLQKGVGDILGSLVMVIVFGAMLGKLVAASGAAQKIASVMMKIFGPKYIQWGLMTTGFIIGIPLFYNVGFVLMVPLIFSVVYKYKLPAVYLGLPMLAALSVTHGFLPPHPSPAALVLQFHANMGMTMFYGILLAIPAIVIAGPIYSRTLKDIVAVPLKTFQSDDLPEEQLPTARNSFISALLPVIVMALTTVGVLLFKDYTAVTSFAGFLAEPSIVMLLTLCVTTFTLGIKMGKSMKQVMSIYGEAVKDIAMILLIIAGSGALKQILSDSGVSVEIGNVLAAWSIEPLFLGWLIAAVIRVCLGSATVAGLTAAGIIAPLMVNSTVNPELMVLSIGAGSLMFSHVNDPGFWMFKEYFNLSIKETVRSWSVMETLVAVIGLFGVLILNQII